MCARVLLLGHSRQCLPLFSLFLHISVRLACLACIDLTVLVGGAACDEQATEFFQGVDALKKQKRSFAVLLQEMKRRKNTKKTPEGRASGICASAVFCPCVCCALAMAVDRCACR